MRNKTDSPAEIGLHLFERAGLGKAPFKFVGMSEKRFPNGDGTFKPGGSCDYCGTGILYEFHLRSADGKTFKVGCDCIEKAGDTGVLRAYRSTPAYRLAQREKAQRKAVSVRESLKTLMARLRPALEAAPHSRGFINRATSRPLTAWDEADWMFSNSGAAGQARLLRQLRAFESATAVAA